MDAPTTEI